VTGSSDGDAGKVGPSRQVFPLSSLTLASFSSPTPTTLEEKRGQVLGRPTRRQGQRHGDLEGLTDSSGDNWAKLGGAIMMVLTSGMVMTTTEEGRRHLLQATVVELRQNPNAPQWQGRG